MKRFILLALPALVFALAVAGCGSDPVSPPTDSGASLESQAIQAALDETPEVAEFDAYELPGESELSDPYGSSAGLSAAEAFSTVEAVRPVFFFRVIRQHERDVHVELSSETEFEVAHVRVEDRFAGTFNIVTADSTDTGVVYHRIAKPLRDRGILRAVFHRVPDWDKESSGVSAEERERDRRCRGWRLVAVSNREIASPEHTAKILSVRLQSRSGLDVTIADPLALMRFPGAVPKVLPGEPVKVTVQTEDPRDRVFLLCGWGRLPLRPVAEGTFEGGFHAPFDLRRFRLGVNAIDQATLHDEAAPYDSDFWGLLAMTVPPVVAEN